jgi:hypothetical protein
VYVAFLRVVLCGHVIGVIIISVVVVEAYMFK